MSDTSDPGVLSAVMAIATVATPILLALFGALGWLLQNKMGKSQARQESQSRFAHEEEFRMVWTVDAPVVDQKVFYVPDAWKHCERGSFF